MRIIMRTSRWQFPPSLKLIRHPLPRYSVIAADTLRDLDLLTLVSGHTWRVTWSTPPPSLKILRLSVLELSVLTSPIGYHWQDRAGHLEARFQGEGVLVPLPIYWYQSKGNWTRYNCAADNFYIMKLCSRLFRQTDRQTDRPMDRRTDGIGVANTALAMRALRAL